MGEAHDQLSNDEKERLASAVEGVTRAELTSPAIYVATERDNLAPSTSRLSILRYDTSAAGPTLIATHEWNLTSDLPPAGSNAGLEGITWMPDEVLVASGFFDERVGHTYAPAAPRPPRRRDSRDCRAPETAGSAGACGSAAPAPARSPPPALVDSLATCRHRLARCLAGTRTFGS